MSRTAERRAAPRPARARGDAGFTLVEMLVSMGIFLLLMGSLAVLFTGTVRTVRQGYALMDAMERARASMAVLERDFKTAYNMPDRASYFQFYGEPTGFVYVGGLPSGRFGRVTYAVHPGDEPGGEPLYTVISQTIGRQQMHEMLTAAFYRLDKNGDNTNDVDPAAALAAFDNAYPPAVFGDMPEIRVKVRRGVILRYEEPGVGDLNFSKSNLLPSTFQPYDPAVPETANAPKFLFDIGLAFQQRTLREDTARQLYNMFMNHAWIQQISGRPSVQGYYPLLLNNELAGLQFWAEDGGAGPSWKDYQVTDDIIIEAWLCDQQENEVFVFDSALNRGVRLPGLSLERFFLYGNEDGNGGPVYNSAFNLEAVNDYAGYLASGDFDNGIADLAAQLAQPDYSFRLGDPLKPRLPAWATPGFWVYGDPPGPVSPPFCQWFQQKVDIPSAYMRGGAQ